MRHQIGFKLTTQSPPERFKNLSPSVLAHTVVIWDGDEAYFWCEKHGQYFEENEHCPQCAPERDTNDTAEPNSETGKVSLASGFHINLMQLPKLVHNKIKQHIGD